MFHITVSGYLIWNCILFKIGSIWINGAVD